MLWPEDQRCFHIINKHCLRAKCDLKLNRWANLRFDLEHPWKSDVGEVLAASELESMEFNGVLGTIGGGNHFAELQGVDEMLEAKAFKRFGLAQ